MSKNHRFERSLMGILILVFLMSVINTQAQQVKYRMTTDIPATFKTPDSVETSLGTLRFFDGFPDPATVQKVYDNLDFQRAVQAYLTALPAACLYALRSGNRAFGPDNETMLITEKLMDSHSLMLPGNTETVYHLSWLDTKNGPLVINLPSQNLGFILDFWGRCVSDIGLMGPDKGAGGKYLLLPPGFKNDVPEGYIGLHSKTFGNFMFIRGFLVDGDPRPAVENTKKNFRIYPLALAANPPAMNFVNISGGGYNSLESHDATLFEQVARVVLEEPLDAVDPETRGLLASIGIRKDRPFAPDARMKKILADAAAVGNATVRTIAFSTRDQDNYFYKGSAWKSGFAGNNPEYSPGGILDLDSKTMLFFAAWGLTPAMSLKLIGKGSQYALAERDAAGNYLEGSNNYKLHFPPNVPAQNFWSLIVYDPQTRSMLQTDQQFPSCSSLKKDVVINPDTSVDIYFGPSAPSGKDFNWIQTVPGKGWFTMLRLYGPLDPWFDKTWRLGEIELIK